MIYDWLKRKWSELSTKLGLVLGALSSTLPAYASLDPRVAYVGLGAALILVLWDQKPKG